MKKLFYTVLCYVSLFSANAEISIEDYKKHVHKFSDETDLMNGYVLRESGMLNSHRFFGQIEYNSGVTSSTASYQDISSDPVSDLLIQLFPSCGVGGLNIAGPGAKSDVNHLNYCLSDCFSRKEIIKIIASMFELADNIRNKTDKAKTIGSFLEKIEDKLESTIKPQSEKEKDMVRNMSEILKNTKLSKKERINNVLDMLTASTAEHSAAIERIIAIEEELSSKRGNAKQLSQEKREQIEILKKDFKKTRTVFSKLNIKHLNSVLENALKKKENFEETGNFINLALGIENFSPLYPVETSEIEKKVHVIKVLLRLLRNVIVAVSTERMNESDTSSDNIEKFPYPKFYTNYLISAYAWSFLNGEADIENLAETIKHKKESSKDPSTHSEEVSAPYRSQITDAVYTRITKNPTVTPYRAGESIIANGNAEYNSKQFADCAETVLRHLFIVLLSHFKGGHSTELSMDTTRLPEGSDVKKFFDEYKELGVLNLSKDSTQETRNKWAKVVCGIRGINYRDGSEDEVEIEGIGRKTGKFNIASGWNNIIKIFCFLMKDYKAGDYKELDLSPDATEDEIKNHAENEIVRKRIHERKVAAENMIKNVNNGLELINASRIKSVFNALLGIRSDVELSVVGRDTSLPFEYENVIHNGRKTKPHEEARETYGSIYVRAKQPTIYGNLGSLGRFNFNNTLNFNISGGHAQLYSCDGEYSGDDVPDSKQLIREKNWIERLYTQGKKSVYMPQLQTSAYPYLEYLFISGEELSEDFLEKIIDKLKNSKLNKGIIRLCNYKSPLVVPVLLQKIQNYDDYSSDTLLSIYESLSKNLFVLNDDFLFLLHSIKKVGNDVVFKYNISSYDPMLSDFLVSVNGLTTECICKTVESFDIYQITKATNAGKYSDIKLSHNSSLSDILITRYCLNKSTEADDVFLEKIEMMPLDKIDLRVNMSCYYIDRMFSRYGFNKKYLLSSKIINYVCKKYVKEFVAKGVNSVMCEGMSHENILNLIALSDFSGVDKNNVSLLQAYIDMLLYYNEVPKDSYWRANCSLDETGLGNFLLSPLTTNLTADADKIIDSHSDFSVIGAVKLLKLASNDHVDTLLNKITKISLSYEKSVTFLLDNTDWCTGDGKGISIQRWCKLIDSLKGQPGIDFKKLSTESLKSVLDITYDHFAHPPRADFIEVCEQLLSKIQTTNSGITSLPIGNVHADFLLRIASENGFISIANDLLKRDDIDVNKADSNGVTPLYLACGNGRISVVRALLEISDIDVNKADAFYRTPLYLVCENGHISIVKALLEKDDIDVNKDDTFHRTPLYMACEKGYISIVSALLEIGDIDVNASDSNGVTPLHIACENGHISIVKALLERDDIDVNKADTFYRTPLYMACEKGCAAIINALRKKGAS